MTTIDPTMITISNSTKRLPGMLPPFRVDAFVENENKENAPQQSAQPQVVDSSTKLPADVVPLSSPQRQAAYIQSLKAAAQAIPAPAHVPFPAQSTPVNMNYHRTAVSQPLFQQPVTAMNGQKGRKRTITLVSGENVDLSASFPVNPQVIEAMRERIFELEDQVEALRQQPPVKRARMEPGTNASAGPSSHSATASTGKSSAAADEKKRKMQLKKIFDQLKRECKSDACKFQGSFKTIKFDEILEKADFDAIFKDKGVLIQPTPDNKPKSVVTIMQFNNSAHISDLFGAELKALKGNRWSRGGYQGRIFGFFGHGGSSGFAKSVKVGPCDVNIQSISVSYSTNNLKCSLKFDVAEAGYNGDSGGWDSD